MITVLSPAKRLATEPAQAPIHDQPEFMEESSRLIRKLKTITKPGLMRLMNISKDLAALNSERYESFSPPFDESNATPAATTFKGDVYLGLQPELWEAPDWDFAGQNLRILSGLFGVLKPHDLIQPYRLEMGSALKVGRKKNLYHFWDDKISNTLNEAIATHKSQVLINLASKEYFSAIDLKTFNYPIIHIHLPYQKHMN